MLHDLNSNGDAGIAVAKLFRLGGRASALLMFAAFSAVAKTDHTAQLTTFNQQLAGLAVPFERNDGQFDPRVVYAAHTLAGSTFVTRDGRIVHALAGTPSNGAVAGESAKPSKSHNRGWSLVETLVGTHPEPRGAIPSETKLSRFISSDPARWRSQIATFERVSLGEPWPGIQVELAARGTNVEKLFTVTPGADARKIKLKLAGAQRLNVSTDGSLVAATGNGPVTFTAPVAWQDIGGERQPVTVAYTQAGLRYGFNLGKYNHGYPVVIDPLLQATFLGGSKFDRADAIAIDASGNVFVGGNTTSIDFPGTAGGAQSINRNNIDAFVVKLDNTLTRIIQATYLGGLALDGVDGIALDASGNVFALGFTYSGDFPHTAGGARPTNGGGDGDLFVAKLSNDLTTLIQATFLGGGKQDIPGGIAVDSNGNVFVGGYTTSPDFPGTTAGLPAGTAVGFVAKFNNALTALVRVAFSGNGVNAIALDASGDVLVTGGANCADFAGAPGGTQATFGSGGGGDVFVARFNNALTAQIGAACLGGSRGESAAGIALDASGNVFVTGTTFSADFPGVAGGAQTSLSFTHDIFVVKLNSTLTTLVQATYLGGIGDNQPYGIVVDASGSVLVAGYTPGLYPSATSGFRDKDAFVTKLNNGLTAIVESTLLGGVGDDGATAIALDATGNVFVAGLTSSPDFPGTTGGAQATNRGGGDAFVAKLAPALPQQTVVEFYDPDLDHYFMTANSAEQAFVDTGAVGRWQRTGNTFKTGGMTQVCRFYGNANVNPATGSIFGPNSHFYTAVAAECANLKAMYSANAPSWKFESLDFQISVPTGQSCPASTVPVYQAYNDGFARGIDSNHRLTSDLNTYQQMIAMGWQGEGITMCAPA